MARAEARVLSGRRIERLRERLAERELDAFLVTGLVNVRYLTGFASSNAALVVDPARAILLTDGRYAEAAKAMPGVELIMTDLDLPSDLRGKLPELVTGSVGFEADHLTFQAHVTVAESGVDLRPTQNVVEALRAVKDAAELAAVRRSASILNEAFERLAEQPMSGRTEAEIAWWMERTLRELGGEAVSFDPIVAGGPNAALPHHDPGSRVIGAGETIVVDAGCKVGGYCSDGTRTFATGALPGELERAYEVCLEAQSAALEAVRAGAPCRDVDSVARSTLEWAGYEVLHNVGHAVGLEIHERPKLAKDSDEVLEAGNVVTVEPGVYLAGLGGMRIEDLAVVGESGPEVLTPVTKELVRVG